MAIPARSACRRSASGLRTGGVAAASACWSGVRTTKRAPGNSCWICSVTFSATRGSTSTSLAVDVRIECASAGPARL